jgi:hypothetical protein
MTGRNHDRSHFFKYASLDTAIRIIESKSFRWGAPTKFNDPFDHQSGFTVKIDRADFAKQLTASAERVVFSDVPLGGPSGLFPQHLLLLRANRDSIPRKELHDALHEGSLEMASYLEKNIAEKFTPQILGFLCNARVFCVSEVHDNVVMWSHYADEHRGAVFKLRCIDEIDNVLLAARRIRYTHEFSEFPIADYARHLTGEEPIDIARICLDLPYVKHTDWSYEREWRVWRPQLTEPAGDGYSLYPENPRVFEAVYLGCRMQDSEVAAISAAIRRHLPNTEIFRAEQSRTAFTLVFRQL